jgi:hypothetical protein
VTYTHTHTHTHTCAQNPAGHGDAHLNPSTQEAEVGDCKFLAGLGYTVTKCVEELYSENCKTLFRQIKWREPENTLDFWVVRPNSAKMPILSDYCFKTIQVK